MCYGTRPGTDRRTFIKGPGRRAAVVLVGNSQDEQDGAVLTVLGVGQDGQDGSVSAVLREYIGTATEHLGGRSSVNSIVN